MSLTVINNVATLVTQTNLQRPLASLNQAQPRPSTGVKINRATDGPAPATISKERRAQIADIKSALDATSKAVSLVQTGEGALNQIGGLLDKVRGLVLDSAHAGVNDQQAREANQAELSRILQKVDQIANNTQFESKNVLDGSGKFDFQVGAQASQTATLKLDQVSTETLGAGAAGVGTESDSLQKIDVRTTQGAEDALKVIDQAISEVSSQRANLGAFQQNVLQSNTTNLSASFENKVAAESAIRDTDFASEVAQLTKGQVQQQAGTAVLSNANQIPQLITALLQG